MSAEAPRKNLLIDALADAYRTYDDLGLFFGTAFDRNLAVYASPGPLLSVLRQVVERVEADGWIDELVRAAAEDKPGNLSLRRLLDLWMNTV